MPLHSPAFPPGPYRFIDREYLTITYRCEAEALSRMVPEPLELAEPKVKFEFMRMPDSTGFGDYCEAGQVIPVKYKGRDGAFSPMMFLNDEAPTAGGRELWGFPKKLGQPNLEVRKDTLVGTLNYQGVRVATGTMGYKHRELDRKKVLEELTSPKFLLKVIPHVDGTARICELVQYAPEEVTVKGAWTGPGAGPGAPRLGAGGGPARGLRGIGRAHGHGSDPAPGRGGPRLFGIATSRER